MISYLKLSSKLLFINRLIVFIPWSSIEDNPDFSPFLVVDEVVAPVPVYILEIESPLSAHNYLNWIMKSFCDFSKYSKGLFSSLKSSKICILLSLKILSKISNAILVYTALVQSKQSRQFVQTILFYIFFYSYCSCIKSISNWLYSYSFKITLINLFIAEKSVSFTIAWKSACS